MDQMIDIVAALIRDPAGRVLLVRKHGTAAFMQPGGKRNAGEDDARALAREVYEELGCSVVAGSVRWLGAFEAPAAHEPGCRVHAAVYAVEVAGTIVPQSEIDEIAWVEPGGPCGLALAPLARDHVLPLASAGRCENRERAR
jgi:8-oxo-dGTP diphosphatase